MTLCAVMRHGSHIHVATDSRLSFGKVSADVCIKVMALPLHLFHATPAGRQQPVLAHSRILGVVTVGSLATTYVAKELLGSVLSSLQFADGLADISMAGITDVCARVLRSVSRDVCAAIFNEGRGQLVLVGECVITRSARAFVLSVSAPPTGVDVTVAEILTDSPAAFFGSGKNAAQAAYTHEPDLFSYQIVRAVCNDPRVPSVGGHVQFGILESGDFRVMGIRDYQVNEARKEIYTGFYIAGVEVYGGNDLLGDSGFALQKGFLSPFESEILEFECRGYAGVASQAHWT